METPAFSHETHAPTYLFLGVQLTIRLSGAQTGGLFTLLEGTMPAGGDGGLHVHTREDETMHLLEGEMNITVGDAMFALSASYNCEMRTPSPQNCESQRICETAPF
jgi:mannose-6-phosphate isomerase-like protein (cupin superfamily)